MIIFFGSSGKYQHVAKRIADRVAGNEIKVRGWWERSVFPIGETTIESIERVRYRADSALLFLTPDDEIVQRGHHTLAARDNVIFEAGFFISRFGRRGRLLPQLAMSTYPLIFRHHTHHIARGR